MRTFKHIASPVALLCAAVAVWAVALFGAAGTAHAQQGSSANPAQVQLNTGANAPVNSGNPLNTYDAAAAGRALTPPFAMYLLNGNATHITTNATTTVKTGAGSLGVLCFNQPGSSETITVYDNTAASGTVLAVITPPTVANCVHYDLPFSTGLTIVTAGTTAGDTTVGWR